MDNQILIKDKMQQKIKEIEHLNEKISDQDLLIKVKNEEIKNLKSTQVQLKDSENKNLYLS